jgi:hypothetical protein
MIIGFPAIIGDLWGFFVSSVEYRHSHMHSGYNDYVCANVDDLLEPWSRGRDVESPEEREMPDPVQFEFAHSVIGKPRVEAVQEHRDLWAEHVHPRAPLFWSF